MSSEPQVVDTHYFHSGDNGNEIQNVLSGYMI